jgi:hypothetical protein
MQADDRFYVTGDHLSDEDYVNLTLLNYDEIAYERLSDPVLSRLALSSELYIATASLEELDRRKSPDATRVGVEVLRSRKADGHLKALAFNVVSERDPLAAIDAVKTSIEKDDPVLVSKVAQILVDHPQMVGEPAAQALAKSVLQSCYRLNTTQPDAIEEYLVSAVAGFVK